MVARSTIDREVPGSNHTLALREFLVGPVVVRSITDREVLGSNPTLAQCEFLWAQEINLRGSTRPRCELVP